MDSRAIRFDGMESGEEAASQASFALERPDCDILEKSAGVDKLNEEMIDGGWLFGPGVWAA